MIAGRINQVGPDGAGRRLAFASRADEREGEASFRGARGIAKVDGVGSFRRRDRRSAGRGPKGATLAPSNLSFPPFATRTGDEKQRAYPLFSCAADDGLSATSLPRKEARLSF